jgi:hypothetical protein
MKREFPVLYEKVSVWIATPLLGLATMFYAQRAIIGPALEIYSTGMAAFGVTAGLSAVCFQMATTSAGSSSPSVYAGEKFLHSSLLLLQTLLVVYVREAVLVSQFATSHPSLSWQVRGLAAAVLSLLAAAAAWTWYHGFSELNSALWRNWERRIRDLNLAGAAGKVEKQQEGNLPNKALEPPATEPARPGQVPPGTGSTPC